MNNHDAVKQILSSVGLVLQKTKYGHALSTEGCSNAFRLTLEPRRDMTGRVAYWQLGHEMSLVSKKVRVPIGTALSKKEAIRVVLRYVMYLRGGLARNEVMLRAA
jgi:hypothetical protein